MNPKVKEILDYHGCVSGDCPHEKYTECLETLVRAGFDEAAKIGADYIKEDKCTCKSVRCHVSLEYDLDKCARCATLEGLSND